MNEYLPWPAVRSDIEWILTAPSLLAADEDLWQMPAIDSIDYSMIWQQLDHLIRFRCGKLGRYFEVLVTAIFNAHPRFEVLANQLIIRHQTRTLGEVDLLIKDRRNEEIIHLELALKFYLGVPGSGPAATRFIGAGLHDYLHQKLNRLYHHQLVLPNQAKQLNSWPSELPFPDRHLLWIPGRLYLPKGIDRARMIGAVPGTHWQLNPGCEFSHWTTANDHTLSQAQPLHKAGWLCGRNHRQASLKLPAQVRMPEQKLPVYVLPLGWHTQAQSKIHEYQQAL